MNHLQTRAVANGITIRAAEEGSKFIGVLEGHAAVFDSTSEPFDDFGQPWVERIAKGAFARSLRDNPDVRALWSHDSAAVIARSPNTMKISEDEVGLKVELHLIDTATNRDALASVRGGLVDAMSFGFIPKVVEWVKGEVQDVRTLIDVELIEVSIVAFPAYRAASIGARSAEIMQADIEAERKKFMADDTPPEKSESLTVRQWAQRLRVT
jgi:uncharacterized protein